MPDTFTFEEVTKPETFSWEDVAPAEKKPFPFAPYAGAGEIADVPGGFQPPQLPRMGFTPKPDDAEPFGEIFGVPTGVSKGTVRKAGAIAVNAAAAAVEGIANPLTPAIVAAAAVAPEAVIPMLTATMAKSGSTKLAEGITALEQGRDSEGVAKVGEAVTELGFAAAPALKPGVLAKKSVAKVLAPETTKAAEQAGVSEPKSTSTIEPVKPAEAVVQTSAEPASAEPKPPEPAAAPAEAPATPPPVAEAKAQAEVSRVAQTEGKRSAKDIKDELVAKIEDAASKAPDKSTEKITIEIPDDGTFTVFNTKENLQGLLARAKRIKTTSTEGPKIKTRGGAIAPDASDWLQSSEPTHNVTIQSGDTTTVVKGKPVTIPGHEDKPFFLTASEGKFTITEPRTGMSIGNGYNIKDAIATAKGRLDEVTPAKYQQAMQAGLAKSGEKPAPKPIEAVAAPSEIPAAPKPSKTLIGLPEEYFEQANLRKLTKDSLKRIGNSLGIEPTVGAITKKAKERFAEMPEGGGPISMGAASPTEFEEGRPIAGTPAHDVETGPVQDRPLGLVGPGTSSFANLSIEMLTGAPTGGVPPSYSIANVIRGLAGQSAPKLTSLNRPAGEALVRYASSKIAAPYKAVVLASKALETGVDPIKFGAALVEDNLRSIEQNFLSKSHEANARGETEQAEAFMEQARNVKSIIGGENSPFQTEDAYQDFLHEPSTIEAIRRHVQAWEEEIEPMYKAAQSIDPDVELPTRGQQTGARINLKAVFEGEQSSRPVTASRGGLTASFKRKSPFGIEARGTGNVYESNYPDIIANTFYRQLEIANQNAMNRILVDNGLAKIAKPGERVDINGETAVAFPLSRRLILTKGETIPAGQNIHIARAFADEYRRALNVDAPHEIPFVTPIANALNMAALWGLTDATVHVSNLMTALFTRPASPLLWDTLAKITGRTDVPIVIARSLIKAAADNRQQLAQLAEIGALREDFRGSVGPLSKLIKWADKTTRLMLDDTYKELARNGIAQTSETARREFVNQVGQYNKRLQGQLTVYLRDTGLGPFVTAGKTFNALGVRNLILSPGLKAASPMAAAALRVNQLAGWVGFATMVGTLNYMLTRNKGGFVAGRPGVPLGNIDLGYDNDKGQPVSFPLGDILGYKRALRVSGVRRLYEAARYGLNTNEAMDNAFGDVLNSVVAPGAGPVVRFGMAATTGYPPALGVGRTTPEAGPQQSQFAVNVATALREANPVIASVADINEGKPLSQAVQRQLPRFTMQASQPVARVEHLKERVEAARINDYADDLARRARRLPINERMDFIREEMTKANLNPKERETVARKVTPRIKYP